MKVNLDAIFQALANPTRRKIIKEISKQELTVNTLAADQDMSLAGVSKHLKVLMNAGLLIQTKDGRVRRCRLNYEPLKAVSEVLSEYKIFWEEQFNALEHYLEDLSNESQQK